MKTKKFSKMLVLNKKTIANLESHDMGAIKGGDYADPITCTQYTYCHVGCPTLVCGDDKTGACPPVYSIDYCLTDPPMC